MQIEILPGFSPKNENWAVNIQNDLKKLGKVSVVRWPHWDTQRAEVGWLEKEAEKIVQRIGEDKIVIIAKSVGTLVAMEVLRNKFENIDKLILCGVPVEDFQDGDKTRFEVLKLVDPDKILIIQNDNDPHGKSDQVRSLVNEFNPEIRIEIRPRNDHEYPYSADFITFISGSNK